MGWGAREEAAWGKSSGMTLRCRSTADTLGGLQEKNSVEVERWEALEIMEGIKSPDCV